MSRFQALLLVSFGGPEKHEDVIPFLENVLRGRNVPRERMLEVAEHYYHFDGRSPINNQNRELLAKLREVLAVPVYWGNRNWHPMLADTIRQMATMGFIARLRSRRPRSDRIQGAASIRRTSRTHWLPSPPKIPRKRSGYRENPSFLRTSLFVEAMTDRVRAAVEQLPDARIVFTAHSSPRDGAGESLRAAARNCVASWSRMQSALAMESVYQSRSGLLISRGWSRIFPIICGEFAPTW